MTKPASLASRLALVATLVAGAHAATGEDFEFEVPLEVSKMDTAFTQGLVHCDVIGIGGHAGTGQAGTLRTVIGSGNSTPFALAQGGFKGTVNVRLNANRPQHQPTEARFWSCGLVFVAPSGNVSACVMDPLTGQTTGRLPAILGLDSKSAKVCLFGTISPPGGK